MDVLRCAPRSGAQDQEQDVTVKAKFALLLLVGASSGAYAYGYTVTANFTGQQEFVQTVTGRNAVRCHYQYNGQEYTKLFEFGTICPMSIELQ